MDDLKSMSIESLLDLLATYTTEFTHIRRSGGTKEEYDKCKMLITLLTAEIAIRKQQGGNTAAGISKTD
ncbi:hypothetical protein [Chitinophaga sp. S165]|uniref:hypothetical protein n=1 Tax=Chitinophaga sp. S165 TaxID=2135462 RepID=UPI000D8F159D|nr:hypothetical protein [Chitinophaga sp. S165]PWV51694.1 hypothetical protein C7475_103304 [Chitinophaga sp. S165]